MIQKIRQRLKFYNRPGNEVFSFTITEMVNIYHNNLKTVEKWGGQILSDKLFEYKRSDRCFILGSGTILYPKIPLYNNF